MLVRLQNTAELLERRLVAGEIMSSRQRDAMAAMPIRTIEIAKHHDVVRELDQSGQCCLLIQGMACSSKLDHQGRRQIVAFHFPGDVPDLQCLYSKLVDSTVSAISPCKIGFIRHEHLLELALDPKVAKAFARYLVREAAVAREWILNLGQRDCLARTAHLLSELAVRLSSNGADGPKEYYLPMTQVALGDALGMSTVHTNRCIRELTRRRLITWASGTLKVLDQVALAEVGHFDNAYLQFRTAG